MHVPSPIPSQLSSRVPAHVPRRAALSLLVLALLCGCHTKSSPTPANFTAALDAYFLDHPECLLPDAPRFPFETSDPVQTRQLNTLVDAQMLTVAVERDIHVSRYSLTPAGARVAPRFCFGHRSVTAIESFTPLTVVNGYKQSQVTYRYRIDDIPVWADSAAIRAAFPSLARAVAGDSTATMPLSSTIAGWTVPD